MPFCQSDRGKRMERIIQFREFCPRRHQANFPDYWFFLLFTILCVLFLASCSSAQIQKSPAKGIYHIVKKGETAYSIARLYSISLQELKLTNNINDLFIIQEGETLFIPGAVQALEPVLEHKTSSSLETKSGTEPEPDRKTGSEKTTFVKPSDQVPTGKKTQQKLPQKPDIHSHEKKGPEMETKPVPSEKPQPLKTEKGLFTWPVKGKVQTHFGLQPNKTYYNWIKISCTEGTKIKAAAGGTVIFSATLKDFGETIIIRHAHELATVYTHLGKRNVKADQTVKKGTSIALAGKKDDSGEVFINFEIRHKGKARNPLTYLP